MNPDVLLFCCAIAAALICTLLAIGSLKLFLWLDDRAEGRGRLARIGVDVSASVYILSACLMMLLTAYIMDSFADIPGNKRYRRREEEEMKKKVRDLFESFPSASYTGQGIGSQHGDCAICLGEFIEGEPCWVLPSCKHTFHSSCFDRWLMIHLYCPTCLSSLLPV
ncbi:RING-H2 finger protein ATL34-like [Rhodamnia argentea]|uniref:RING-type E3 ubiquitin transferase n=1 Tax=Rhodamnia argentea TaxID=178133 RepID=A0ABM3HR04_9MYRT|nr:RING-H2 finger protein ATL34-like [Rhodamnia argentea]